MKRFFRLLLTGKDNETYEIARVLLFFGFFAFIAFAAYDVFISRRFDPINFSAGLTGLLFGGSGGIAVKSGAEPDKKNDN